MWQAGILILYLIHHAHTANDPRCPALNRSVRCKSYLKGHQCQTDTNCHGGKVCCPLKCGKECVIPIPLKPRPGVCPSVPKDVPESCANIFLTSDCQVDADCKHRNQKCCRQSCGNLACTDPIKGNRPGCPVCSNNPGSTDCPLCAHFNQQCNADSECQPGETCCYNPSCGTWCQAEVCRLPKLHGPCRGSYPRYYFNFKTQKCEKFTYGGCLGNANNFESLTECRDKCIDKDRPVTKPGECPPNTPGIACALFVRPGDCVDDGSCPGKQKCCLQRCSRNCVDPEPRCGPVCAISCPFGNVLDENNCPICRCKTEPVIKPGECPPNTPGVICPLFVRPGDCTNDGSCPGKQKCCQQGCSRSCVDPGPRCGPVCAISCPFGNVLDEYNCPICRCKTGCTGNVKPLSISCGDGQRRCPGKYQCNTPPAGGSGVCCPYEPGCGSVPICAIACPFGYVLDENNCPTCECKTGCAANVKPLPSTSCGSGQRRCPPPYKCNTPSAGGSGVCCPYECPLVRCSEPCPYGYFSDPNGCQTCECKPRCGPVCAIFCPFGNVLDENNCPTCACKTGCAGNVKPLPSTSCGAGQRRCPPRYQCNTPPAGGSGVCCPYVCPQVKCGRPCPYGYKYDDNGCQTCQCLPACEKGTPQGTCRIGPFPSTPCPSGTYCKNSVCCKIPCKFGYPHPTLSCGIFFNKCPAGYSCLGGPADEYFACCPDENKPTPDKCPRDRYQKSKCYVRRSCRNDSSCHGNQKCCKQGCQYKCVNPVY